VSRRARVDPGAVGLLSGVAVAAFLVLALAAALGLPFAWRVRSDEPAVSAVAP
jgi:hypothetical protein